MMSGSKAPDFDAYGLFRATHSHNPTPIFAYRGIIIPLFPLISLLYNAGFHGYLLLGYVVYLLGSKKGKRILLIVPTLLVFAVCILSPVNGELSLYAAGDDNASAKSDMVCLSGKRICCRKRGEIK